MGPFGWLTLVLLLACYISFTWSVIGVFHKPQKQNKLGYALIKFGSLAVWSVCLYQIVVMGALPQGTWRYLGLVLIVLGLTLFWYAVRSIKGTNLAIIHNQIPPEKIVVSGAFRFVRHPFYTSYFLVYLGQLFLASTPLLFILSVLLVGCYVLASRSEERMILNSPLAPRYQDYMRRTGAFFPKFFRG